MGTTPDSAEPEVAILEVHGENGDKNQIRYEQKAWFKCYVELNSGLSYAEEYDGMFLKLKTERGEEFEDGCLGSQSPQIPENKKLFSGATKNCPNFIQSQTNYTVVIEFDVSGKFVGMNTYQCIFKRKSYSVFAGTYTQASPIISQQISLLGSRSPMIFIDPETIAGFQGENKKIKCTAYQGYPFEMLRLKLGSAVLQGQPLAANNRNYLEASLTLSKKYNGKTLKCFDTKHPNVVETVDSILVKYLTKNNLKQTFSNINSNIKLNCENYVSSNTELKYEWVGDLVPYSQVNLKQVDIIYSSASTSSPNMVTCKVSMVNDTFNKPVSIEFTLLFDNKDTPKTKDQKRNAVNAIIIIIAVLLVLLILLGYGVGREVSSKKLNSMIRVINSKFQPPTRKPVDGEKTKNVEFQFDSTIQSTAAARVSNPASATPDQDGNKSIEKEKLAKSNKSDSPGLLSNKRTSKVHPEQVRENSLDKNQSGSNNQTDFANTPELSENKSTARNINKNLILKPLWIEKTDINSKISDKNLQSRTDPDKLANDETTFSNNGMIEVVVSKSKELKSILSKRQRKVEPTIEKNVGDNQVEINQQDDTYSVGFPTSTRHNSTY